jgi:hypothetical protein
MGDDRPCPPIPSPSGRTIDAHGGPFSLAEQGGRRARWISVRSRRGVRRARVAPADGSASLRHQSSHAPPRTARISNRLRMPGPSPRKRRFCRGSPPAHSRPFSPTHPPLHRAFISPVDDPRAICRRAVHETGLPASAICRRRPLRDSFASRAGGAPRPAPPAICKLQTDRPRLFFTAVCNLQTGGRRWEERSWIEASANSGRRGGRDSRISNLASPPSRSHQTRSTLRMILGSSIMHLFEGLRALCTAATPPFDDDDDGLSLAHPS